MEANNTDIQTEQTNNYHQGNKNYRGRGGNYKKVYIKKLKPDWRK